MTAHQHINMFDIKSSQDTIIAPHRLIITHARIKKFSARVKYARINAGFKKNNIETENTKDSKPAYPSIKDQKTIFDRKVKYFNQKVTLISMEGDDLFSAVVDKLVSLYSQSKESIDANIPKGVDAIKYMVAKRVTKILLGDGFEIRQIDVTANTTIDPLALTKKRKNKYGLEMTDLEQELDDIKIGLKDIEKYQGARYVYPKDSKHPKAGQKENPKEFFVRVYSKFWSQPNNMEYKGIIYQDDLMAIDKSLWIALRNHFDRNESQHIRDFLPNITNKSSLLVKKAKNIETTKISRRAEEMIRRSTKANYTI